jgi:hypothetical protein
MISRSQFSASDMPIPAADPPTAAITGFSMPAMHSNTGRYSVCSMSSMLLSRSRPPFKSAPALNDLPSPVTITARTELSPAARSQAARRSRRNSVLKEFIASGR